MINSQSIARQSFTTIFLLALLLIYSSASLFSQDKPRNRERGEQMIAKMKEKLSLSDEQAKKIGEIMKTSREQMDKDRENFTGNRDAMRQAMMERMEKTDAQIEKLLIKEQKPKYEDWKKERRAMMRERMQQ